MAMKGIWEDRFEALAVYNAENARGIMHTEEYREKMKVMQDEYDRKLRDWNEECGIRVIGA